MEELKHYELCLISNIIEQNISDYKAASFDIDCYKYKIEKINLYLKINRLKEKAKIL